MNIKLRLYNFINNVPIRKKMIVSYIVIVTSAVVAVAVIMLAIFSDRYEKQLLYSASQSYDQAQEFLAYRADSAMYASNLLQVDTQVQEILKRNENDIKDDLIQQNSDMIYMENYVYSLCNSTDIFQISIYVPEYLNYVNQEVIFRNLNTFEKTKEYEKLLDAGNTGIWLPPEEIYSADTSKWEKVISYLRLIRDNSDLNKIIGVQRVSMKYDDIYSILDNSTITESGFVCLKTGDGEIIATTNDEKYEQLKEKLNQEEFSANTDGWRNISIDQSKYFINENTIENTNWTLIAVIPENELFGDFQTILTVMALVLIIVLMLAVIFSIIFSKLLTIRIFRLSRQMENFEKYRVCNSKDEDKENVCDYEIVDSNENMGKDEIGSLFVSFNSMRQEINELIKKEYENGKSVKQAELKALQAQINPHFLYNTLDLINWKALDCGADSIVDISQSLAKFYRASLNKGREISSLKEELDHIKYYVQIQNYRFENRIKLAINAREDLLECKVLHIILQPLVENSIVHGMSSLQEDEEIYISVNVQDKENGIEITVEDTGCGLDVKVMNETLSMDFDKEGGYGVRNINARIKLCYGKEYGLRYRDNSFGGTSVIIRIPKITASND